MIMRYIDGLLYFNFIFGYRKYLNTLFLYKNIISRNIETEAEVVFSCYLRNLKFCLKLKNIFGANKFMVYACEKKKKILSHHETY